MHRILEETIRITAVERDYNLSIRLSPVIPSLRGQNFAAKAVSLVSLRDKTAISTSGMLESYGVNEEDAARACVEKVERFLHNSTAERIRQQRDFKMIARSVG